MHDPLLWGDLETLGLNPHKRLMLEAALVLTDANLAVVAQTSVVIHWSNVRDLPMDPIVREMHEVNGLFDAVEASTTSLQEAEDQLLAWAREHGAVGHCMAGRAPHFDRGWVGVHMPALARVWSHRNFDMTTLRYFLGTQKTKPEHRALADCLQGVSELRSAVTRARRAGLLLPVPAMVA